MNDILSAYRKMLKLERKLNKQQAKISRLKEKWAAAADYYDVLESDLLRDILSKYNNECNNIWEVKENQLCVLKDVYEESKKKLLAEVGIVE